MKERIREKCDLLMMNTDKLAREFKWSETLMNIAAALVFTNADREVDIEKLRECRDIVKKNAGVFSSLRSSAESIITGKMALTDDPMRYFRDVKSVYDRLSKSVFSDGQYLVQAAISIVDAGKFDEADEIIIKFKELYKKMSKEHPMLTSSEDIIFAVLLIMTGKSVDTIITEMEDCYTYLKKELKIRVGANEIQGLSEVLALSDGNMREKSDRALRIYDAFSERGVKYGKEYNEFASLGALIDIDVETRVLVDEIIEAADYLKGNKKFGSWSMDKKQRLMFAAMLVGDSYSADASVITGTTIGSTVAMVIAEEVAIIMCLMIVMISASNN
ncbi:MAG: DUF4003 family protein [Eubacterium sp.]|nr:DUF4003 family protein [Eubacterium sp.]